MFRLGIIIAVLLASLTVFGQEELAELRKGVRDAQTDSAWVDATNALAAYFLDANLREVIELTQKAYVTGADINYHEGVCESYLILAKYYSRRGDLESALGAIDVATAAANKCKDKGHLAECYFQRGQTHFIDGNVKEQLKAHQKALEIRRGLNDKLASSDSYNGIASIHYYQGKDSIAKVYFEYALALRAAMDDQKGIAGSYNNLALVAKREGDTRKYFELMRKALKINKEQGIKRSVATNLGNMGIMFVDLEQLDSAWILSKQCFDIRKENGYNDHLGGSYKDLGSIKNLQGQHAAAIPLLYSGLGIAHASHNHDLRMDIYTELVKAYTKIGREDSVKLLSGQLVALKDSLDKANSSADWEAFQKSVDPNTDEQSEKETSQAEEVSESEDNNTMWIVLIGIGILVVGGVLLARRKRS